MDYIQDFNETFYLYDEKIDVTDTSKMVEWYAKYETTVEYYNNRFAKNIQKPPMPQFTLSEEKNEQIAHELYLFGFKLYNDQFMLYGVLIFPQCFVNYSIQQIRILSMIPMRESTLLSKRECNRT